MVGIEHEGGPMVTVNVVVLAGTVSADPVHRRMPSGDEVAQLGTVNVVVTAHSAGQHQQ